MTIPESIATVAAQFRASHPDYVLIFPADNGRIVYVPNSEPTLFAKLSTEELCRDFIRSGKKVAVCAPENAAAHALVNGGSKWPQ